MSISTISKQYNTVIAFHFITNDTIHVSLVRLKAHDACLNTYVSVMCAACDVHTSCTVRIQLIHGMHKQALFCAFKNAAHPKTAVLL